MGHSPFFLNYGYHSQHNISPDNADRVPATKKYLEKLPNAQEKVAGLLKKSQEAQTTQYNRKEEKL